MPTIYKYNDYEYTDTAGEFTTEEVRQQLTQYFPELANATAKESTDDEGNAVIEFVKRAGTKGLADRTAVECPPMSDVELFKLEEQVRWARNGNRVVELDPNQVLSLIGEARYLRQILTEPEPGVRADGRD